MNFEQMEIGGVSVILLIMLIVQVAKDWLGLKGNWLRILSAGLGIGFGVLFQYTVGWPGDAIGWIVFSVQLLYGVLASGLVDLARGLASYVTKR